MGEAAEIGEGRLPEGGRHHVPVHPSIAVGYPNLFALLDRHDVRATFFIEGWNGLHHADTVAEIVDRGHELGMHGWVHERWHELDEATERDLATRATEALTGAAGVAPVGFRAPGGDRSPRTERILRDLGYRYDASIGRGMAPSRLPSGLAQVPFVWPGVDGFHYLRADPADPESVRDGWKNALRKTAERGGLFVTVCHAFLTGIDDNRIAALESVMAAACADDRVEVRTVGELAASL